MSDLRLRIDGVVIPTPTEYVYSEEDLSSEATGRTLDGLMHKDVVSVKATYKCKWGPLDWNEASTLLSAVSGKTFIQFTHADPKVPTQSITGTFYIGARTGAAINLTTGMWEEISFTFIEQ